MMGRRCDGLKRGGGKMRCPSHPIFEAVKEDLTVPKFSQHLPLRWSAPDLKVAPEFSQHLSRLVCS